MKRFLNWALIWLGSAGLAQAANLNPAVATWLAAQTNIQTWSADFVQTRALKSLVQPLKAAGKVWFAAPNRFRWEMRQPGQTIAVRAQDELLIIYPRLKQVERYPLGGSQTGPWRDALALLEAGFPRNAEQLEAQYTILSQTNNENSARLVLQPRSAAARRMITQVTIDFDTKASALRGTELHFADGSTLRNDFTNAVLNPPIPPDLFKSTIPSDYKVVEPLKKQ